jgi:hypothetical protein
MAGTAEGMNISWNQPIQSDGRYLTASIRSREEGNTYLPSADAGRPADPSRSLSIDRVLQNRDSASQGLLTEPTPIRRKLDTNFLKAS